MASAQLLLPWVDEMDELANAIKCQLIRWNAFNMMKYMGKKAVFI